MGGGLVGAGLPEQALLAGDRVGSRVDLDPERATGQLLYVTFAGPGHEGAITRSDVFGPQLGPRLRTVVFDFRFLPGAAYRNRTDDLRITRGLLPRSYYMTCTDSTAMTLIALGFRCIPFHDPFHGSAIGGGRPPYCRPCD